MKCNVYESTKSKSLFLILPENQDVSQLPAEIQTRFQTDGPWKTIDVESSEPLPALDPHEVLSNIQNRGYHIAEIQFRTEEFECKLAPE